MNVSVHLFLIVLALVFFMLAGLGVPAPPRIQWLGWGLFFLTLAEIFVR